MPSEKLKGFRQKHPEYQGYDDVQLLDLIAKRGGESVGRAVTPAERSELYKTAGVSTGTPMSGFLKGVGSGVNPLPDAVARAIMPDSWADTLHSWDEALPGEEGAHMAGSLAGNVGSLLLPGAVLGKAGKLLKMGEGLSQVEKAAKLASMATKANVGVGAVRGVKNAMNRGEYYNEGKVGALPAIAGGILEAGSVALPAFGSMKTAVLGSGALGAAQAGIEDLIRVNNGGKFEPADLAVGGVAGGLFGGAAHGVFNSPSYLRRGVAAGKKVADKFKGAARPNPAAAAAPVPDPAKPSQNPDVQALLAKVRGAAAPTGHPSGDQAASTADLVQKLTAAKEQLAELQLMSQIEDTQYYPATRRTLATLPGDPVGPRQIGFNHRLGDLGDLQLIDDAGKESLIDPNDLFSRYHKAYTPEGLEAPVNIGPGFHPINTTFDDAVDGEPVYVVGFKPAKNRMQQRYLVVKRGDLTTYQDPIEVPVTALQRTGQEFRAKAEEENPMEAVMGSLGDRPERPLSPEFTPEARLADLQTKIEALLAAKSKRDASRAAKSSRWMPTAPPKAPQKAAAPGYSPFRNPGPFPMIPF